MTMCQPMVMMSRSPLKAELTRTTGPGSKNRRAFSTGKSCFLNFFMGGPSSVKQEFFSPQMLQIFADGKN